MSEQEKDVIRDDEEEVEAHRRKKLMNEEPRAEEDESDEVEAHKRK